jgi:hypothetical protein
VANFALPAKNDTSSALLSKVGLLRKDWMFGRAMKDGAETALLAASVNTVSAIFRIVRAGGLSTISFGVGVSGMLAHRLLIQRK